MLKDDRTLKRYSESFKLKVLKEIETGKYSKSEVLSLYDLSPGSLYSWIKKYSRFDLLNRQVKILTMSEKDKIKELEKQIRQLKELLVEKDLTNLTDKVYFQDAVRQLGFKDIEDFKKKVKKD